jgi:hypothetical protein
LKHKYYIIKILIQRSKEIIMKNFIDWAGENKKELPLFNLDEKTHRGSIATWAYPDAAARAQYPAGYFLPIAADAMFKLFGDKAKKNKSIETALDDKAAE